MAVAVLACNEQRLVLVEPRRLMTIITLQFWFILSRYHGDTTRICNDLLLCAIKRFNHLLCIIVHGQSSYLISIESLLVCLVNLPSVIPKRLSSRPPKLLTIQFELSNVYVRLDMFELGWCRVKLITPINGLINNIRLYSL